MITGTILTVSARDSGAVTVTVEGEEKAASYTVARSVWDTLGSPEAGAVLSDTELDVLRSGAECREAYRAAVRILEAGDNNRRTLLGKLLRHGFSRSAAAFAVSRMTELGYIREGEQALRLTVSFANGKKWGPGRIRDELSARGYREADIEAALERAVASGEVDFPALRAALLSDCAARGVSDAARSAALYRFGYDRDGND